MIKRVKKERRFGAPLITKHKWESDAAQQVEPNEYTLKSNAALATVPGKAQGDQLRLTW